MAEKPEYRFYPWARCYDAVVKGRVWAAFPYSYTKERAKQVLFSKPLSSSRTLFFYYAPPGSHKTFNAHNIADLKKYRVGGVTGYYYEEMFKEAGLKIDYVNREVQGIEKLILGRIDLMPMNEYVARDLIQQYFPKHVNDFKTLDYVFSDNKLSLIVSKKYPHSRQWLERFNAALTRLQEKHLLPPP
jgi:polar amino acid transport system substrate-binding protein